MSSGTQSIESTRSYVEVPPSFHRSVNLPLDWNNERFLESYIVTPALSRLAEQIATNLVQSNGSKSWTLTGPYGTGKSAFAAFLAGLFTQEDLTHPEALRIREEHLAGLQPLVPILVQAERESIKPRLRRAIESARIQLGIQDRYSQDNGHSSLVDQLSRLATDSKRGILLVIDELGKFLEHAAKSKKDDIFLLQQLAETAERNEPPILFVSMLHAGFSDYANGQSRILRSEWSKVQGRFRDVPFVFPYRQQLDLISRAISVDKSVGSWTVYARRFQAILSILGNPFEEETVRCLKACLPLHPIVAAILWSIFSSKVAQNERSLFSFLTSQEPFGFVEFLAQNLDDSSSLYDLGNLFDYISYSLGLSLHVGRDANLYNQIKDAIERVSAESPSLSRDLIKAIGLLSLYGGEFNLRPSYEVLCAALDQVSSEQIRESLDSLEKASILLFRKHKNCYGLWEGSDLDLDSLFDDAAGFIDHQSIDQRLMQLSPPRPIEARAHFVDLGTPRYLKTILTSVEKSRVTDFDSLMVDADGAIVFVVDHESSQDQARQAAQAISSSSSKPVLVAVPKETLQVHQSLETLERLLWMQKNIPELEQDRVARSELNARTQIARGDLEALCGHIFGLTGHVLEPSHSDWFYAGRKLTNPPKSHRQFRALVSDICTSSFPSAPILQNELLNRHKLSTTAVRARRNLIERILTHEEVDQFGFSGSPPERSMYRAFLESGGFHRFTNDKFKLTAPLKRNGANWTPVWKELNGFLNSTSDQPRKVSDLYQILKSPPYGMRDGPLPVLLCIALQIAKDGVALFEDGVFVPSPSIETYERLLSRPSTFELRSFRLTDFEQALLRDVLETVEASLFSDTDNLPHYQLAPDHWLVHCARTLVQIVSSQPPFTQYTQRLSTEAKGFRDCLGNSRDPRKLILEDLPALCNASSDETTLPVFIRNCLVEITHKYPDLLQSIDSQLRVAFSVPVELTTRERLVSIAHLLEHIQQDQQVRLFLNAVVREYDGEYAWLEGMGRALRDGKPTKEWRDDDVDRAEKRAFLLAVECDELASLLYEIKGISDQVVATFRLRSRESPSLKKVVAFSKSDVGGVSSVVDQIKDLICRSNLTPRDCLIAMSLVLNDITPSEHPHERIDLESSEEIG